MMDRRKTRRLLSHALRHLRGRWVAALALMVGVSGMVVLAAHEDGFSARAVELGDGSVWVASNGPGQLALLDGASAEITVKLRVARDADDVVTVTGSEAGFAVNRTTGTLLRVDDGTWQPSDAHVVIDGAAGGLTAIAGNHSLFATDNQRGLAVRADPTTLAPDGEPRSLSAIPGPGSPVVDSRGVLWLLDAQRGNLIRMTDAPQVVQPGIADPAGGRLVLVDDRPVVVDLTAGTATPIDPDGSAGGNTACVDVDPADGTVHVLGSSTANEVYAVSGADGVLRITDLDTGDCSATVAGIAGPGSDLGQPVEAGRHVFVPDYGTGQVIVVDLDDRTYRRTQALVEPGADFDLIDHDGFAFYNQRTSNRAGVIDPDGGVRTVAKYDVDDPGTGVFEPPSESPSAPGAAAEPAAAPDAGSQAGDPPTDGSPASGTDIPPAGGGGSTDPAAPTTAVGPAATPTPVIPISPNAVASSATSSPNSTTPTPAASGADSSPVIPSSVPASPSDPTTPSGPTSPAGVAPHVDAITITSFPGDGKFLSGDVLTFAATTSGGTPDTRSWRLRYANDDGTPQNHVERTSTDPTFSSIVDSGGSSFQKWVVDVTAANAAGTSDLSRVFQVDIVDGRPFQVNAVNAAPNPVVTAAKITVTPSIQGPLLTCQWWIENAAATRVADPIPCDQPQNAPAPGDYTVRVAATSRQNTPATGSQPLTVKNIDPPTVSACTAPSGVGAHENAKITATAAGTVTAWHWKIRQGSSSRDIGVTGDTADSFTFVPAVADTFQAEVWVSNAGGDSAHQTCSFTVVDLTPPVHTITKTGLVRTQRVTLTVSDPESAVTGGSLSVHYLVISGCSGEDSPPQTATANLSEGTASLPFSVGTCLDTSRGAPPHSFLPNFVEIESIDSTATSGGGTAVWTD